jgi:hypothetical protein
MYKNMLKHHRLMGSCRRWNGSCVVLTSGILVGTEFQLVYHTINTSPTCWIKTQHITTSVITPHTPTKFNSPDFNYYPFLIYIYITYIILNKIIILIVTEWWWQVCFCILVKGTSPEYRPKHDGENIVNKIHHKYLSAFAGYLYIMITMSKSVSNNKFVTPAVLELQTRYVLNT